MPRASVRPAPPQRVPPKEEERDLGRDEGGGRIPKPFVDVHSREVATEPASAFGPIRRIGGSRGWYAFDRLWRVRSRIDSLFSRDPIARGRRDPESLTVGDRIDWWEVEAYVPNRRLRLQATMKLPGRAWLEYEVEPSARGSIITQTSTFEPDGLSGRIYWYSVYPLHWVVFEGMLDGIARAALSETQGRPAP